MILTKRVFYVVKQFRIDSTMEKLNLSNKKRIRVVEKNRTNQIYEMNERNVICIKHVCGEYAICTHISRILFASIESMDKSEISLRINRNVNASRIYDVK